MPLPIVHTINCTAPVFALLFDRLFYHGLINSIEAREVTDSVSVHIPDSTFFSPVFFEKVSESGKKIGFEVDSTLEHGNHILIVY